MVAVPGSIGGVHCTAATPAAVALAITLTGAAGAMVASGVAGPACAAGFVPAALVAVTETVYAVPLDRPVTVAIVVFPAVLTGETVAGLTDTVYPVIGEPPSGG